MENTDELITKITGSNNYMKEIEKVVGCIDSVDLSFFMEKNAENIRNDECIRSYMKKLLNEETKNFFAISIQTDFNKAIVIKNNKRHSKKIADNFKPKVFIKSPYFKFIKKIEKTCNNLIESYNIDTEKPTYESVAHILSTNHDLMSVKNFFGYELHNDEDVKAIVDLQKASHKIIENYLSPMYDVKKTMAKNWGILAPMFKNDFATINSEIQDMLYLFVVAKYRCQLTDNNKYYMKLFMDIVNKNPEAKANGLPEENVLANMDPARFLELLDNINFESISQKKSVYEFANKSKNIIHKIANKKPTDKMEDILKDLQEILDQSKKELEENGQENLEAVKENETTENNDILSNL